MSESTRAAPPAATSVSAVQPASVIPGGWACVGSPPDIDAGWKTEIAVVPATAANPMELAARVAHDKLRASICVNADKDQSAADACSFLASKIEPWTTGQSGRDVCASAVIKKANIDAWSSLFENLGAFDKSLAVAAQRLVDGAPKSKSKATPPPVRVAIAAVYDDNDSRQNQLPGGRRADWLAARFRVALPPRATVVAVPKGWTADQGAPSGTDIVVIGKMWRRVGVTVPSVEVSWTGYYPDLHQVESAGGTFPEAAAPSPPSKTPPPIPSTPGLFLTMDSDHAGSICAGEITQLWLKSSEELFIRVFDLWGADGAVMIYPPDASVTGKVPAKQTIALGDAKGFEAIPAPGSEDERYLVIGAPSLAGLGRFAAPTGYCRLGPQEAASLIRGESIPAGSKTALAGYRLLTGTTCPPPPSAAHVDAADKALARLPLCPR